MSLRIAFLMCLFLGLHSPAWAESVQSPQHAKTSTAKKSNAKTSTTKKSTTKKKSTAKKKSAAKKSTTKKKSAAKKSTTKKKSTAKKSTTKKKSAAKKSTTKKKSVAKKSTVKKKSIAKKSSPKKITGKNAIAFNTTKHRPNLKRRKRLMHEYQSWKGTRYRLGGDSRMAIDCSALTKRLYQEAFSIDLPRTTTDQLKKGKKAKYRTMHIGDLVFFKTGRAQKHVGIYIGEDRFIHASRSKGVTISELSNPYWNHHLLAIRRVLPETVVR